MWQRNLVLYIESINCSSFFLSIKETYYSHVTTVKTMTAMAILKLKNAVDMWTPPFGARVPICDINIWKHQNNENYTIAVAMWMGSKSSFTLLWWRHIFSLFCLKAQSHCDDNGKFFQTFPYMPLPSQCEQSNWSPWYPFLPLPLPSWMGIEPIYDGSDKDTKIMKIMPLTSQCQQALKWCKI